MANILKQIKVGNTTYNIEPVTAYLPLSDLGNTTFKVTRGASQSTKNTGYWAGMLHSTQGGSPVLPSNGKWWHVISMDWTGTDTNNWISQLALPTQDGGVPHYRSNNNGGGVSIDNSTWHAFITDENIGSQSVSYASNAGWAKANDVYDWAKAATKPSYTKSEVGLGNVDNTADANKSVKYATNAGNADTVDNKHASSFAHIGADNNLLTHTDEFTFASSGFSGAVWLNYRTAGGTNGNITEYKLGNGAGGQLGSIIHSGNIGSQSVNYANSAGSVAWGNVSGKPSSFTPASHTHSKSEVGLGNVDNTADANKSVNYATSSHLLRTYGANNSSHGADYYLKCRHNVDGNERFKLQIVRTDGSVTHSTSVDYANSAGSIEWGNVTGKPSTFPPIGHGHSTATQSGDGFMSANDKKKLDGIAAGANKTVVDSSLSSSSNNPVKNSAIYSAFSSTVGFDYDYYSYGEMGSWRLLQYHATGNTLDIRHGVLTINAQEKTYSITFANPFNSNTYVIVCGIYRDNRNSWFWSPLITKRTNKGFSVYVRGNTSGDNSGTLFYIAIRSN